VYWSDFYSIYSAPAGGGQASLIFSGPGIGRLELDGLGALYFTVANGGGANQGSVHRLQNRTDTVLVANTRVEPAVAVDDTWVYFATLDNSQNGYVRRVPKQGGSAETVIGCGSYCQLAALKTDASRIYLRALTGEVWSVSKANPSLVVLSGRNGASTAYTYTSEIDAWGSVVYWNFVNSQSGVNGIFSASADGSQFNVVDTGSDSNWYMPRADDSAVYYWHQGSLIRRLK
jgi:hypothetical protein